MEPPHLGDGHEDFNPQRWFNRFGAPTYLTVVGNTLYFRADDGTNGTEGGCGIEALDPANITGLASSITS